MKYAVIAALLLVGCSKEAEQVATKGHGFEVEFLFENEGCRVYRFSDGWRPVYYTNCRGNTSWTENCGKNCHRQVQVPSEGI